MVVRTFVLGVQKRLNLCGVLHIFQADSESSPVKATTHSEYETRAGSKQGRTACTASLSSDGKKMVSKEKSRRRAYLPVSIGDYIEQCNEDVGQ